jgi:CelD/BcsL family acetyltransferase involved in cellulose biosynthesis
VAADPAASVYQTPEWTDAICSADGYTDVSRLYELPGGRTAILPLVRRVQPLTRLATEASPPAYWGTGGLVSADGVRPEDTAVAWADLLAQRAARIRVRPGYRAFGPWRRTPPRGAVTSPQSVHVLSLDGGFEEVWAQRFASSTRRAVRKAEKAGLEVECDTTGRLVGVCHDLYLSWLRARARDRNIPFFLVRRRNALEDSLRKYKAVAAALGSACRVFVARRDGHAVAAAIVLVWGDEAIYWRGYGDPELAHPTRANNLIQRAAIEEACSAGCATYNMGESGGVESLMEFKRRHGAEPREFAEFTLERLPLALMSSLRERVEQRLVRLTRW